jgi:hypothetical protein
VDGLKLHQLWMKAHLEAIEKEGVKVFKLSTTERQEFKECRRRWDLASLSRQGLEPKRPAIALWFGTGIHYALEHFYNGSTNDPGQVFADWAVKEILRISESQGGLWDEQVKELEQMRDLGIHMLRNYVDWAKVADYHDSTGFAEVLYTEVEFQMPILDEHGRPMRFVDAGGQVWEVHLVGRFDMVVRDFLGRHWLLDHKTSKDKLDPEILILDDQMTVYLWAAQHVFDIEFEGALYNVLRKKLPTVPKVLASGKSLSKDKSIDTTAEVYAQAVMDNGFDLHDYDDILERLNNKPNTFFQRERIRRNQHELAMAGYMLQMEGIDMLNAPFIYTNPTWDCKWKCDFRDLCKAMNRNDDVEWLLNAMFQKRPVDGVYARESTIE